MNNRRPDGEFVLLLLVIFSFFFSLNTLLGKY